LRFAASDFDTVEDHEATHEVALKRLLGRRKYAAPPQNDLGFRSSYRMPIVERREFFLPDLDPVHDGLKVAHLTDIHVGRSTPARRVLDAVAKANLFCPDLTVLTGDYLSHHDRGLGLLREQFSGLKGNVVAVLGNHDHWVDPEGATSVLQSFGYAVLRNQNTTLSLRGAPFTVVGIDDLITENHDVPAAFSGARKGSRLVLAHAPRTAELLQGFRASLCLAGHTHGGHVNLPGVTAAIMRRLREHYLAGRFHVENTQLYVSRGIGGAVMPFRINAPPEVTLITLRSIRPDMRRVA
jgi:predicted MPP superfamily phosphohydrolase